MVRVGSECSGVLRSVPERYRLCSLELQRRQTGTSRTMLPQNERRDPVTIARRLDGLGRTASAIAAPSAAEATRPAWASAPAVTRSEVLAQEEQLRVSTQAIIIGPIKHVLDQSSVGTFVE